MYLIEILHQTTTLGTPSRRPCRCILSKFYIKPQPSTLIVTSAPCCILSKFYIKPQRPGLSATPCLVVSYRNSTSNHNHSRINMMVFELYLIEILHQTTTTRRGLRYSSELYLIEILHQTTTNALHEQISAALYLIEILHQTTTVLLFQ